jgi:hypothetical protein
VVQQNQLSGGLVRVQLIVGVVQQRPDPQHAAGCIHAADAAGVGRPAQHHG